MATNNINKVLKAFGISSEKFLIVLGIAAAAGISYGGYSVYKNSEMVDYIPRPLIYMSNVVDGDTFDLESGERIRLSGIDAPEKGQCYSEEAKDALEKVLLGQSIRVTKDVSGSDNFGRLIRFVTINVPDPKADNILVNEYMIRNGFAKYMQSEDGMYRDTMIQAQASAKSQGVGMWGACKEYLSNDSKRKAELGSQPTNPNCLIKGNISDVGYGKKYYLPGCPSYNTTRVDTSKGEGYFCSEQEAQKAGFTKSENCN
jgi:micrococcal nuclease